MRFGIITQYYPPEIGAPQARLSELARIFVQRGHEVFILTAMPNYPRGRIYSGYGGFFRREQIDGIHILRSYIYPTKKAGLFPRLTNYFSFVGSSMLVGMFALPKLDFLLTESPPLFTGISGYFLSSIKGSRWIFNVSDLWPDGVAQLGVVKNGLGLRLAYDLEAFCYRQASLVTCQSHEILNDIQSRFPQTTTYHLSNGVDTNLFQPKIKSTEIREKLSNGKGCLAVYAGLHGLAQGLEQLLEAAVYLQDLPDLEIAFIGDGPEKEDLQRRCRELELTNVRFHNPYPRETMPQVMAAADIALVPLKYKILGAVPSKLYEAMAAGLPIMMVAEGEAAAIVNDTESGLVVMPGDIKGLASKLRELTQNSDKRIQMGNNGRQTVLTKFNRQTITDSFIDFLERN